MRITEAARRLGTSARMLRYRERLGLLPPIREGAGHRQFAENDLRAAALALALERRYDISPVTLAFGLRAVSDPDVQAAVRELGERLGRLAPPTRALDFDKEKALRLLAARAARPPPRPQQPPHRPQQSHPRPQQPPPRPQPSG